MRELLLSHTDLIAKVNQPESRVGQHDEARQVLLYLAATYCGGAV